METDFTTANPKSIEMTMTITMKLGEWEQLADQLVQKYPSWKFAEEITRMIRHATKHFKADVAE